MKSFLKIGKMIIRILLMLAGLLVLSTIVVACIYLAINRTNGKIVSSGIVRKYLLYVPESYNPTTPTPLVISMHGFAEWPAHQMRISHWNDVADEYGFIVVYPSGTQFPLRWNAYNWPGAKMPASNEVQFISDLIDHLSAEYNLDPARIYANGLSNGGGMSVLLACQLSERITAIGSVSGAYLLPWDQCVQSRPVPIIAFHGTEDPIVPYVGGGTSRFGSAFPNIPIWIARWAQRYGCDPGPVDLPSQGEVSGVKYSECNQDTEVIFYTVHGGGHAWPGGGSLPKFIVGHTTQDIDATRVMWKFFSRYTLEK